MEGRDYNDGDVLAATKQENDGGKVRYSTLLPSGRKVTSEWMKPDDMSGQVVIKWCEFVREQIDVDAREKEAVKKRASAAISEGSAPTDASSSGATDHESSTVPEALQYAVKNRDHYETLVREAEEAVNEAKVTRKKVRLEFENWSKIVEVLRGENDG